MKNKLPISAETFVWALQASCQLHRVPCSPELALREFPPPYHSHNLLQLLQAHGLKCRWRSVHGGNLEKMALPCFVTIGPDAAAEDGAPHGMLLLVKVENGSALYFEPGNLQPLNAPLTEFAQRCSGHALLIGAPKAEKENTARKFGFAWFVPELMKHKAIWRDVLLASLALQLMALATPLFTQVVIDKVVVHHTANTLVVIGVGMILFMLFSAAMSWVRQYLVTHTGNRIDAVLGLQLFEHLFRLPLRYFEHRATGTLVARFQGMESIREFLSGAAVTLILDVPFLLVFLAVMFYYSWLLTLVTLVVLGAIVVLSVAVTPLLRQRLNHQFLIGARNQAFVTEYIAGMETVKSLQMEPQLRGRYGDYLADYLHANFNLRQLSNTYNTLAGMLEQLMVLAIL
ncbi:MAG: ABC transporter transmembrane domain-containing protein, partial [Pseudomonadota bacterium]